MSHKTLVRGHLEYAGTVWNPYKIKYITAIEQVQKELQNLLQNSSVFQFHRLSKLGLPVHIQEIT